MSQVLNMPTRRQVILAIATLAGGTAAYTAGSFRRAASRYDEAVRNTWRHTTDKSVIDLAVNRELVRYASHPRGIQPQYSMLEIWD